jgi:predicted AAA+ superfamily ATPase
LTVSPIFTLVSSLAENIVLNHLRRGHEQIYYGGNGGEIDFIVKEGIRVVESIQVWQADAVETAIPVRKLAAFESLSRSANPGECILITNDLERMEKVGKKEIRCVPWFCFSLNCKE